MFSFFVYAGFFVGASLNIWSNYDNIRWARQAKSFSEFLSARFFINVVLASFGAAMVGFCYTCPT